MDQRPSDGTWLAASVFRGELPFALFWYRCQLPIIPTDLFPRDLSNIIGAKYSRVKISFDVICLAVTGLMTGLFLGHLDGLGIGTVLAAFTMGKVVGLIGDAMDKKVRFVSVLSK